MTPVIRSACIGATTLLLAGPIAAQEDDRPFARVRLDPGPSVTVGQPLRIIVEVLVPSYFTGGPRFSALNVPDALTLFEDRGTNFTERFGREAFAGQSRSYVIYPQRPGVFRVNAISVTVPYFDDAAGRTTATVSPPPVSFEAVLPPEAEGLSYFISTTRLSLRARYDPVPDTIRVGDAFTRTITATVDNALAMVIPPLGADPIPGLAVYTDPPFVNDEGGERGSQVVGTRSEAVTFVALEEGEHEVPGAELRWWDVNASRMRTASVDPVSFVVLPPLAESAFALPVDSAEAQAAGIDSAPSIDVIGLLRRFGPLALGLIVAVWFAARIWRRHGARWMAEREAAKVAKAESEKAYYGKFRDAARTDDPRTTLSALTAWHDRARGPSESAAVSDWIATIDDAELTAAYEVLLEVVYGSRVSDPRWASASLLTAVTRARKSAAARPRPHGALPRLNPTQP